MNKFTGQPFISRTNKKFSFYSNWVQVASKAFISALLLLLVCIDIAAFLETRRKKSDCLSLENFEHNSKP